MTVLKQKGLWWHLDLDEAEAAYQRPGCAFHGKDRMETAVFMVSGWNSVWVIDGELYGDFIVIDLWRFHFPPW